MSEQLRSRRYQEIRVLIETARVLDSSFNDGVLHITGAQIELLRNLTAYAHRESTFVSEYRDVDYLTPTVADWDSLQAIIADLEEKLMGNENVIFGYYERYREQRVNTGVGAGDVGQSFSLVPEGEVWVVTSFVAHSVQTNVTLVRLQAVCAGEYIVVASDPYTVAQKHVNAPGDIILSEGDRLRCYWYDCAQGDDVRSHANGYKMKVPS